MIFYAQWYVLKPPAKIKYFLSKSEVPFNKQLNYSQFLLLLFVFKTRVFIQTNKIFTDIP